MNILLLLLPYWTPLIPPMGISCLKSHLQKNGYEVKTVDFSVHSDFKQLYENYFDILRDVVPEKNRGNFFPKKEPKLSQPNATIVDRLAYYRRKYGENFRIKSNHSIPMNGRIIKNE